MGSEASRGCTLHRVGILDQVTGQSWQPWFERYVYGTEMPPLAAWQDGPGGVACALA